MKQIKTVFKFTLKDALRKKSFKISTIIMLVLIFILSLIPQFIPSQESDNPTANKNDYSNYTIYYIDDENLISEGVSALSTTLPGINIVTGSGANQEQLTQKVDQDKNSIIVSVTENNDLPFITITEKDFMAASPKELIADTLSKTFVINSLIEQGIDNETAQLSQMELGFNVIYTGDMNFSGYTVGILLTLLIFFAIYYYGYGVAISVATEKTTRVMETLVVSAKPSKILLGKCLAMGTLGLMQFAGIIAFTSFCVKMFIPEGFAIMGMPLSFSAFTWQSALLIFLYFILGYSLFAVMNSVCGASVSKIEDLNSAMAPVIFIAMISFYLGYFAAVANMEGIITKIAMYLPFSSAFIMPFKLLNGNVAAIDLIISIALMVLFIIVITFISIRIYSASVLHYGKRQKLIDLYKTKI